MFLDGYIAAPPTMTVFSSARAGARKVEVSARALNAAADKRAMRLDMECSRRLSGWRWPAVMIERPAIPALEGDARRSRRSFAIILASCRAELRQGFDRGFEQ